MAVIKNMSTQGNREFWTHVESVAAQVRSQNAAAVCIPAVEPGANHIFDTEASESRADLVATSQSEDE